MINLYDTTFVIHAKDINEDNIKELRTTLKFINTNFRCHIMLVESGKYSKLHSEFPGIGYLFVGNIKSHTECLNRGIMASTTRYGVVLDQGLFVRPSILESSINELRNGLYTLILPYSKKIRKITYNDKLVINGQLTKDILTESTKDGFGNLFSYNKTKLAEIGLLNQTIESDYTLEIAYRTKQLGTKVKLLTGELYSLSEIDIVNSSDKNEIDHIKSLDKEELTKVLYKWDWNENPNRVMNAIDADAVLFSALDAIKKADAVGFITQGTLLGAVRENDYISHDLDIDLGVNYTKGVEEEVRKHMLANGFKLELTFYTDEGGVSEDSFRKNGLKLDIFYFKRDSKEYYCYFFHRKDKDSYYTTKVTWEKFLVRDKSFRGNMIPTPYPPQKFLETHYGEYWQYPQKEWIYFRDPKNIEQIPDLGRVIIHNND